MSYPTLPADSAAGILSKFSERQPWNDDFLAATVEVDGPSIDLERVAGALELLYDVVDSLGEGRSPGFFARFEGLAATGLHTQLALPPQVAGDPAFWRWLTFSHEGDFAHLVNWRYASGGRPNARPRYFLGHVKETMYGYLWLRANAVFDPTRDDPYALCRRGDVDLWQSHVVRVDFGSVPAMARAFVRMVHSEPSIQDLSREDYRALAIELTRRNSSMLFELFDDEQALEFIKSVWRERTSWMPER
jgi:hypothetical protein